MKFRIMELDYSLVVVPMYFSVAFSEALLIKKNEKKKLSTSFIDVQK